MIDSGGASGSLSNLLRAPIGYAHLAKELRLPLAPGLGFPTHGSKTFFVLPLANLLLGSAFRFENGLAARRTSWW
jgi:hypothetical protein